MFGQKFLRKGLEKYLLYLKHTYELKKETVDRKIIYANFGSYGRKENLRFVCLMIKKIIDGFVGRIIAK
ncbi:hypothetical protein [Thermosipho atlanticus]|uniref:Uncharacterized protein n=1 Tax=Thermosipho atlanticus DSM 15807 TaxID=1123380 RepID=A0A1M5RN34_9BACT|nr:hypothetical protein [Thermosipho atlanticus]SHH27508.1 hypothetical protein SAMN02745199_0508 [Thermosipho atlanticus DSM 15807]